MEGVLAALHPFQVIFTGHEQGLITPNISKGFGRKESIEPVKLHSGPSPWPACVAKEVTFFHMAVVQRVPLHKEAQKECPFCLGRSALDGDTVSLDSKS